MQHDKVTLEEREKVFIILERVLFLKDVEVFKNVGTEQLSVLAEIAHEVIVNKSDVVANEGEQSETLFIIKSGSLSITKEKDGQSYILKNLMVGECFGVFGLFGNRHRNSGALANEKSVLFEIRKNEFKRVLLSNPEIAYNILGILSDRIDEMDNEIVLLNKTLNSSIINKN